jgi:hypothetical protein
LTVPGEPVVAETEDGFGTSADCAVFEVSDEDPEAELQTLTDRQTHTQRQALSGKRGFTAGPSFSLRNDLCQASRMLGNGRDTFLASDVRLDEPGPSTATALESVYDRISISAPPGTQLCACQDRSSCARSQPLFYFFSWSRIPEGKKPQSGVNCGVSGVRGNRPDLRRKNRCAGPTGQIPAACVGVEVAGAAATFPPRRPERIPPPPSILFRSRRSADPR